MKRLSKLLLIICTFFIMGNVYADEATDISTLSAGKEELYFKAEESLQTDANVNGSSFIAADSVTQKGRVNGIGFLFGETVQFGGDSDYGIMAGNNVDVYGTIQNDAFVAGNVVRLEKDVKIGRDLVVFANSVIISGEISRDIKIFANKVEIKDANITGKVRIYASKIDVESTVEIGGELSYVDSAEANISSGATIGSITKFENPYVAPTFFETALSKLIFTGSLLIVFIVCFFLTPSLFNKLNSMFDKIEPSTPFLYAGKGAVFLLFIPMLLIFLFMSVLGVSLALILLVLYLMAMFLSSIFTGYMIGSLVGKRFIRKEENILLNGLIGMMILYVFSLIPHINGIVTFVNVLIGLGIVVSLFKKEKVIKK